MDCTPPLRQSSSTRVSVSMLSRDLGKDESLSWLLICYSPTSIVSGLINFSSEYSLAIGLGSLLFFILGSLNVIAFTPPTICGKFSSLAYRDEFRSFPFNLPMLTPFAPHLGDID